MVRATEPLLHAPFGARVYRRPNSEIADLTLDAAGLATRHAWKRLPEAQQLRFTFKIRGEVGANSLQGRDLLPVRSL